MHNETFRDLYFSVISRVTNAKRIRWMGPVACIVFLVTTVITRFYSEDEGIAHQIWRVAVDILNKQSWTDNRGSPSNLGVGKTTTHYKNT